MSDSATPWTIALQASLSMGFSRQEYWSGWPFPSLGDVADPGIKPSLLHCRQIFTIWAIMEVPHQWISSVHSVVSNSFEPHGLQHARLPCPSPTPGACSNSGPSSWWCYPTTSSSVVPFSSCLQSFPASESFPMSHLFTSGGQSIGVSASASVLPMNIPLISFRMDWLDLLAVQGTLKSLLQHHSSKAAILRRSAFFIVQLSHLCMTTGKAVALTRQTFVGKVMSLL